MKRGTSFPCTDAIRKRFGGSHAILKLIGVDTDFDSSADGYVHPISTQRAAPPEDRQRLLLTVKQAKQRLGIGKSQLYVLLGRGEIKSVKIGRSRRIPATALDNYIEGMMEHEQAM